MLVIIGGEVKNNVISETAYTLNKHLSSVNAAIYLRVDHNYMFVYRV